MRIFTPFDVPLRQPSDLVDIGYDVLSTLSVISDCRPPLQGGKLVAKCQIVNCLFLLQHIDSE